jgi:hypothetical protein
MRVALAILCLCAVTFLLRFLAALVKEGISLPHTISGVRFGGFEPPRRPGELIEMNPKALSGKASAGSSRRMAL